MDKSQARTFPEMLDAAETGEEFKNLVLSLFWSLEACIHEEESDG